MSIADKLLLVRDSILKYEFRLFSIRSAQIAMYIGTLSVLAVPVAAQTGDGGGGIAYQVVCGSELGALASGLFTLLTIGLIATSVWRGGNGFRKMSDPRPKRKQEGREETKGGLFSLAGALLIGVTPELFSSLGLTVFDCIQFGGVV